MQDSSGHPIRVQLPTRPGQALQVPPSRKLMKTWEWGNLALIRRRFGTDLETAVPAAIALAELQLSPATPAEFEARLTPVLSLCAPSGMGAAERTQWIKAAIIMLGRIPSDLLAIGCLCAMETSDHPSKIVPAILKAIQERWNARKADLADLKRLASACEQEAPEF